MNVREYWTGSRFVAEWTLVDTAGAPIVDATVTGEVRLPDGTTTPMTVAAVNNVYTVSYVATVPGSHGYALAATGTGVDAHEGTFTVRRPLLGLPPIEVDPTTDVGMVRLLATDLDEVEPLFTDAQITAFVAAEGGNVKRGAALALETIAVSEALISKKIRTSDGLTTDGPAVAKELRERARALRQQADEEVGDPDDYGLGIVDFDPYAAYRRGRSWC